MLEILDDPATTGLVVVATPAEMPVSETLDLTARLRAETKVNLAAVVVNRVLPELFGRGEEEVFERLATSEGESRLDAAAGGPTAPLMEAARLTVTMRRSRTEHLETLRAAIDPTVPLLYVPYLFFRSHGLRATHQLADALSAELGY
jgi:anion-transporting  ArsA/GET3 family ATPase